MWKWKYANIAKYNIVGVGGKHTEFGCKSTFAEKNVKYKFVIQYYSLLLHNDGSWSLPLVKN